MFCFHVRFVAFIHSLYFLLFLFFFVFVIVYVAFGRLFGVPREMNKEEGRPRDPSSP